MPIAKILTVRFMVFSLPANDSGCLAAQQLTADLPAVAFPAPRPALSLEAVTLS
jgi:hypothetical protein